MIKEAGDQALVDGAMNLNTAAELLSGGNAAIGRAARVFDMSAVTEVDSSGLAVVFAWVRTAKRNGLSIRLANPPQGLLSMADVYGVSGMLPLN
ncbi:MAG: STAS domain-containing protein [Rhodocyclaceae bacterium]|nr:MAG: STAS domain-containing protein [Rhodocyclaceae bacterium]